MITYVTNPVATSVRIALMYSHFAVWAATRGYRDMAKSCRREARYFLKHARAIKPKQKRAA